MKAKATSNQGMIDKNVHNRNKILNIFIKLRDITYVQCALGEDLKMQVISKVASIQAKFNLKDLFYL
jgi:hypothetical protein